MSLLLLLPKWIYNNEIFIIGSTVNFSYGGLGEEISDLHSLRAIRGWVLWLCHQVLSLRAQAWIALRHNIYSHLRWTNQQWVKIKIPESYLALVMLEILGTSNSSLGVPEGWPASTYLGIWSSIYCHALTFLGILQSRGPRRLTCLDLPRDPILRKPRCLNLPRDLISMKLSCINLHGNLHPDLWTPSSQVAIVLGSISFRKTQS